MRVASQVSIMAVLVMVLAAGGFGMGFWCASLLLMYGALCWRCVAEAQLMEGAVVDALKEEHLNGNWVPNRAEKEGKEKEVAK